MSEEDLQAIEREIAEIEARQTRLRELLAERTRLSNERFASMTPAEKRVALARDVIMQLQTGHIVAEQGTYLNLLDEDATKCEACALGSIFVCAVAKPELALDLRDSDIDHDDREGMHEHLSGVFSREQLNLIETAFEMDSYLEYPESCVTEADEEAYDELFERAMGFGLRWSGDDQDKDRLIAIMQNVVENEGTFKP